MVFLNCTHVTKSSTSNQIKPLRISWCDESIYIYLSIRGALRLHLWYGEILIYLSIYDVDIFVLGIGHFEEPLHINSFVPKLGKIL